MGESHYYVLVTPESGKINLRLCSVGGAGCLLMQWRLAWLDGYCSWLAGNMLVLIDYKSSQACQVSVSKVAGLVANENTLTQFVHHLHLYHWLLSHNCKAQLFVHICDILESSQFHLDLLLVDASACQCSTKLNLKWKIYKNLASPRLAVLYSGVTKPVKLT